MNQVQISAECLLEGFKYELEATLRPKTVEYYCVHLRRFVRWARDVGVADELWLIDKQHIYTFFHYLLQVKETAVGGNGSRRQVIRTENSRWPYYVSLKRFFGWLIKEGYLSSNPMDGITLIRPKLPPIEPYRAEHLGKMLELLACEWQTAKTPRQKMLAARDRAILLLFLESGLRCGEMANLVLSDIDLAKQRVFVSESKTGNGRIAGFGSQTKKALWRYLSIRFAKAENNALWLTEEGKTITLAGIRQVIRRVKKDAGLHNIRGSVHKLRHTFATTYLKHTRDMKGCRILLGHSTLAMTERYTQFIDAEDALKAYGGQGPLDWLVE